MARGPFRTVGWVVRETLAGFVADDCLDHAASLAFYALFSLAPLLVVLLQLAALATDPAEVARFVEDRAGALMGNEGAAQVRVILESADRETARSGLASVASAVVAVIGATTVLVALQRALNRVWRVGEVPGLGLGPFLLKRAISVVMLAVGAVLLIVSLFASTMLAAASGWLTARLPGGLGTTAVAAAELVTSFVVLAALFSAAFRLLPDTAVPTRQACLGGVVTSALFVAGKCAVGQYLGSAAVGSFYGAAGSLLVVLVWVYTDAALVLLGAELTRACTAATHLPSQA